jgi:hypothetical protein
MVATPTPVTAAPRVLRDVLVVQTYYVHPRGHTRHFEIHLASEGDAARTTVLVTREQRLYQVALDAEGTDRRVHAHWRVGRAATGKPCQVLVQFTDAASPQKGRPCE